MDARQHLIFLTERSFSRLANNLNAIPDDKVNVSPGGAARTPVHIVAECAVINRMVAKFLAGHPIQRPAPDERERLLASYDTREKALTFLTETTDELKAAILDLPAETLWETVEMFPGRPMTRFACAELPATHQIYHDGQIAYLQTLYGDTESHW